MDIRVFVFESDYFARQGIKFLIARDRRTRVVGELDSLLIQQGEDGTVNESDILLICSNCLPEGTPALDYIRRLVNKFPTKKIVILDSDNTRLNPKALLLDGVAGFLMKNETRDGIASALVRAFMGKIVVSHSVLALLDHMPSDIEKKLHELPPRAHYTELTSRLQQVTELYTAGMTTDQIADELKLSTQTIRTYVRMIHEIINASDRWEAFARITARLDEMNS